MNQQELRESAKRLKWEKNIDYKDIAKAIGMNINAFYNYINNEDINLGYKRSWKLMKYIGDIYGR